LIDEWCTYSTPKDLMVGDIVMLYFTYNAKLCSFGVVTDVDSSNAFFTVIWSDGAENEYGPEDWQLAGATIRYHHVNDE
jgi:hypothetical protein